jgi:predicted transcriptional regulator
MRLQRNGFIGKFERSGELMKTKVFFDGFEGHVRRSLERAQKMSRGERVEAQRIITFEDPLLMIECLTVQRIRLCQVVRKKRLSISALAEELGRNRGSVTRDVNKLKKFGLLRLREEVNPGHGVVQIVEPAAEKFEMRITL